MAAAADGPPRRDGATTTDFDVVVVGAGFAGMYTIHRLRQMGLSVQCFEAGGDVGGTWYWNVYPGCRVDIESFEYSYSFSDELQQEWKWSERYASQPELLRYCRHVAERFDLRRSIRFDTRITQAHFDEASGHWRVATQHGDTVTAQFCIFATGLISEPHMPHFDGLEDFRGDKYLSSRWPREPVDFSGKRVGIIGTGASGVQMIPIVARQAQHLSVFQRTPTFTVPLQNKPMDPDLEREMKARYRKLREMQFDSMAGFTLVHSQPLPPPTRSALELDDEARLREYENRWASGGLCFYYTFTDVLVDQAANDTLSEFFRHKIRARVRNPEVAEKLVPEHPALTRRLAADTGYQETYDRDNVSLIDLRVEPIDRFTAEGLRVGQRVVELDAIVFATGFDIQTGAMDKIDIRGCSGRTLKQHWGDGLRSYLGMTGAGFPNLFWLNGPGSPFFNPILLAEYQVDWIARLLEDMRTRGRQVLEASSEAETDWVNLTNQIGDMTLFSKTKNYYMGDNIPGKPRSVLFWLGGFPAYREQCEAAAQSTDTRFHFDPSMGVSG